MCRSHAEGGRRCTGHHLSLDQHRERAERRRARDRERKRRVKEQKEQVEDILHPSQREFMDRGSRMFQQEMDRYGVVGIAAHHEVITRQELRARGWQAAGIALLGEPRKIMLDRMLGVEDCWDRETVLAMERTDRRVMEHLKQVIQTPETRRIARETARAAKLEARAALRAAFAVGKYNGGYERAWAPVTVRETGEEVGVVVRTRSEGRYGMEGRWTLYALPDLDECATYPRQTDLLAALSRKTPPAHPAGTAQTIHDGIAAWQEAVTRAEQEAAVAAQRERERRERELVAADDAVAATLGHPVWEYAPLRHLTTAEQRKRCLEGVPVVVQEYRSGDLLRRAQPRLVIAVEGTVAVGDTITAEHHGQLEKQRVHRITPVGVRGGTAYVSAEVEPEWRAAERERREQERLEREQARAAAVEELNRAVGGEDRLPPDINPEAITTFLDGDREAIWIRADDRWAILTRAKVSEGSAVQVHRRNGSTSTETIGTVTGRYTIDGQTVMLCTTAKIPLIAGDSACDCCGEIEPAVFLARDIEGRLGHSCPDCIGEPVYSRYDCPHKEEEERDD